jgi:hypothetical protein
MAIHRILVLLLLGGCTSSSEPIEDELSAQQMYPDTSNLPDQNSPQTIDTSTNDAEIHESGPTLFDTRSEDSSVTDRPVDAKNYCEYAAEVFCPYYVRCSRMAVETEAECLETFVPACNSRYEPTYVELAARELIQLSTAGLSKCKTHLETVSCEIQVFDLDLGCSNVWSGLAKAGDACGPGIESFVCEQGTTCVLGLDFCGVCSPTVATGQPCGTDIGRCEPDSACDNGICVKRPLATAACTPDGIPCVTGTWCDTTAENGPRCSARSWSAPGEPCNQSAQCQYKSQCGGSICIESALIGEPCDASVACAAGYCTAENVCAEMQASGEPCSANSQCTTGNCSAGTCGPVKTACFE